MGWFNTMHIFSGQLGLTLSHESALSPTFTECSGEWGRQTQTQRDECGTWARRWPKEHWPTRPTICQPILPKKNKNGKNVKGKPALALKLGKEGTQNPQTWLSCCSQSRLSEEGCGGEGHGLESLTCVDTPDRRALEG